MDAQKPIYGLMADPSTIREHMSLASGVLPAGGFDIMREQVDRILAKGGGQLSFAFVFGISLAIWSANAGMKAMIDALNVIYNVPEERNLFDVAAPNAPSIVAPLDPAEVGIDPLTYL